MEEIIISADRFRNVIYLLTFGFEQATMLAPDERDDIALLLSEMRRMQAGLPMETTFTLQPFAPWSLSDGE